MCSDSFAAAKRPVETEDNVIQPAWHDHDSRANRVSQASLIELAHTRRYFTEVIKSDQVDWPVQLTQIFRLDEEVVAIAETIITKATQRDIPADVRCSQSLHQIKRNSLTFTGLTQRQATANSNL